MAKTETERKQELFAWAVGVLEQMGLAGDAGAVARATSAEAVDEIELNLESAEVVLAIRDALHPASGRPKECFAHLTGPALKIILKNQFAELTKYRKMALEGTSSAGTAGDTGLTTAEPVNNPLEQVSRVLREYVYFREPLEYVAVGLWVLHTFVAREYMFTPRLLLYSADPDCGKSTVLGLLKHLAHNPWLTANVRAAGLYHTIDRRRPTVLIDEGDNMDLIGDVRSIFNSGHWQIGSVVTRVFGRLPRDFETYAPLAFASIRQVQPPPMRRRSIAIYMQRASKAQAAALKRLNIKDQNQMADLAAVRDLCRRWAQQYKDKLDPEPAMDELGLPLRRADNWRALISVGDACGYGGLAREAAVALSRGHQDATPGMLLLLDTLRIFNGRGIDRIFRDDLVDALNGLDDSDWADWRGEHGDLLPHKLSRGELARILGQYQVKTKPMWPLGPRVPGTKSGRGYYRRDLEPAWTAVCPEEGDTTSQPSQVKYLRKP